MMNLPSEITICEVGLRDGLQNEKTIVSTEDKLSLLRDLVDAGFPVIEVGSFMHPKKVPQMAPGHHALRRFFQIRCEQPLGLLPLCSCRLENQ